MEYTEYDRMILAARPAFYWPLSDAAGNFLDLTPNGVNATSIAVVDRRGVLVPGGRLGVGFGNNGGATAPSPITPVDNFTMETWVFPIAVGSTNQTILFNQGGGPSGYALLLQPNLVLQAVAQNITLLNAGALQLSQAVWNHIVCQRVATQWIYWVNGKRDPNDGGATTPNAPTSTPLVGVPPQSITKQAQGVAFYSRPLLPVEIVEHYQLGRDGPYSLVTPKIAFPATGPDITPPFFNVGTGLYTPGISDPIVVPFLNVGVGIEPANMFDGGQPPFVPPSLPPTIPPGTPTGPGVPLPPLSSGGIAGIRFYQGPPWRWVVTDLDSNAITFLDRLAAEVVVTYGLDKGSTAKLSVPSDNPEVNLIADDGDPYVNEGNRLLYGFRREGSDSASADAWKCRFAGKILQVEDAGDTEVGRTIITAFDPWHILYQWPMVNIDGDFPDQAGFFSFDDTQVGVIALTFLRNAIVLGDVDGRIGIDIGDTLLGNMVGAMPGTTYWGHPYQALWSGRSKSLYETTTEVDTDCQQGLMVGEIWDQQVSTGALDLLLTPIYDPVNRPGYMAELSIYERVGRESDTAVFAWDKPSRNVVEISNLKDGIKRANTIRYYQDQGGPPVGGGIPVSYGPSILKYGETWHEQFWPGRIEAAVFAMEELQLELMQDGIKTVAVTPSPERAPLLFSEYWLGDTFPVHASSRLRQAVDGFQRMYGVVLNIDENAYEQIPQLLVSVDEA